MKPDSHLSLVAAQELPDPPGDLEWEEAMRSRSCPSCGAPPCWHDLADMQPEDVVLVRKIIAAGRELIWDDIADAALILTTMEPFEHPGTERKRQQVAVRLTNAVHAWSRA